MSIDKLAEFAKDGDKNLDNLDVSKGFLQSEKPERQWFNQLFNNITNKVNEVVDNIVALPFDNGALADTFVTVTANDGYDAASLQSVVSDIRKTASYIVYAEKYGSTLNEAMDAINLEFAGKRVRIYVPSDYPITATVNINIDCDLMLSSLQVQNDVDVIFNPVEGWNGSTTACDVFCNNKSIRIGWDFKKALGYVTLDKFRFFDIGNQVLDTSAEWFCGFYLSNKLIKQIDLYNPAVINSYVKPNGATGDTAGINRGYMIEGYVTAEELISNINIYNPYAENLMLEEDSDAIAISVGANSYEGLVLNIDIYNPSCKNVQRRFVKIIGNNKKASGIRFHGDAVAEGGGVYPHTCVDISRKVEVTWNGSLECDGWVQGLLVWDGAVLNGALNVVANMGDASIVTGTAVRGLSVTAGGKATIDSLSGTGGLEILRLDSGCSASIKNVKHDAYHQSANIAGDVSIDKYVLNISEPASGVVATRAAQPILYEPTAKGEIKDLDATSTTTTKLFAAVRVRAATGFEVQKITAKGFDLSAVRLAGAIKTKLHKVNSDSKYAVYCETGGSDLLLDQCKPGTVGLIANTTSTPLTNVVEINTLTF